MRAFSTRVHGSLDYALAVVAIVGPWLWGFAGVAAARNAAIAAGVAIVIYSLLTDYERGVVRRIQPPLHLWLDGIVGLLLGISPWLLGFDERVWIPHVAIGVALILVAFFSDTIPGYERRRARG
jgi:hypothetical protein